MSLLTFGPVATAQAQTDTPGEGLWRAHPASIEAATHDLLLENIHQAAQLKGAAENLRFAATQGATALLIAGDVFRVVNADVPHTSHLYTTLFRHSDGCVMKIVCYEGDDDGSNGDGPDVLPSGWFRFELRCALEVNGSIQAHLDGHQFIPRTRRQNETGLVYSYDAGPLSWHALEEMASAEELKREYVDELMSFCIEGVQKMLQVALDDGEQILHVGRYNLLQGAKWLSGPPSTRVVLMPVFLLVPSSSRHMGR